MKIFKKEEVDLEKALSCLREPLNEMWNAPEEWIETNGLGGWSSSTILGCHTRRYHGLLIAATHSPADREALVSKLDECVILDGERFELGTNQYGDTIQPEGIRYLKSFERGFFPRWFFEVKDIQIEKTMAMVQGENTTLIRYEVKKAPNPFTFELLPLIAARDYHSLQSAKTNIFWDAHFEESVFSTVPYEGASEIYISIPGAEYHHDPRWFYNFQYKVEEFRGLDHKEDLFNHGTFTLTLKEGDTLGILVSTQDPKGRDALELLDEERKRKEALAQKEEKEVLKILTLAADQFIVKREENLKTIIAGFHWFADWGRDTMIALPGLCLSTGRSEEAKAILRAFAKQVSEGMLPNRFRDKNQRPEYNNVDGTLWYFVAVKKYWEATKDKKFVLKELLPVMRGIIEKHFEGTRYHIKVDKDGLLQAGEEGVQLTWMDAKIGDHVVTPRMGKPVEIQALWYNALSILSELLKINKQKIEAAYLKAHAKKVKKNFLEKFWYEEGGYFYDNIDFEEEKDKSLRPNQLLALSLPYVLSDKNKAQAALQAVREQLLTPRGLRTLSGEDPNYVAHYGGDPLKRDSSYHQGTAWAWLLGSYVDAVMSEYGTTGKRGLSRKKAAEEAVEDCLVNLNEGCIGSISEIFDPSPDFSGRGCVAQAWSVAELLRVIKEYDLDVKL